VCWILRINRVVVDESQSAAEYQYPVFALASDSATAVV
jgi:hypothetical protein